MTKRTLNLTEDILIVFDLNNIYNKGNKMLREIYIDRFNKIISNFKPELFHSLSVVKCKPYNK